MQVLLLNYPNNPCAVQASCEFFQAAIGFCLKHDILLVHDNPYVDQVRACVGRMPPSQCISMH